jgi:hypothetical protein
MREARHAAIHEAGHAVAAVKLGLSCYDVSIDKDGGREFRNHEPTPWLADPDNRARLRKAIIENPWAR